MQPPKQPGKFGSASKTAGAGDVDALNKILNNINVQAKKSNLSSTDHLGEEGKLPPIKKNAK